MSEYDILPLLTAGDTKEVSTTPTVFVLRFCVFIQKRVILGTVVYKFTLNPGEGKDLSSRSV